ncbi:MAG: aminotransferase class I/II-fold pyridoxal phosphate-dependent enzyme [Geminicoccaceae bacterium]|jgi:aspartate/methionine/tyrosine aminotransferase|nr:aminotransferase class I/II-fold pyridoxal phosphate-dependent enzyme [Geminicoccaceae bacterium]MCB9969078.1 aminotransferase class I/II-fold pyridoxal phosphate-dependent enzyme [Geminicoccaceae bacterium]HRY23667.1 aminotransferase class I/II-fold pyridoxal phosphate-dependent enzyme [Geminicoccaceae bacterium]
MWNQRFGALSEFPFRRLAALLARSGPPADLPLADLSLGEPQHAPPPLLAATLAANAGLWNRYPPPAGTPAFRAAATRWLERRFELPRGWLEPDRHILPVAGTKEALFLVATAATDPAGQGQRPAVLVPNPLYSVYLGAAVLAGAEPVLMPASASTGFLPDLDAVAEADLARATVCYICSPANPQGVVADRTYLARALDLARRHDFLLVVDECYAEIYDQEPPPSALEVAAAGGGALDHLVVMHSLSKRSSAAGLRSGFVAGDPDFLALFLRLRAYGAAVQPMPVLAAAAALWDDDAHVETNRLAYRKKFDLAETALAGRAGFYRPPGGFFLWLDVGDGEAAAVELWRRAHVKVLPGAYLTATGDADEPARDAATDPGTRYVRVALVHEPEVLGPALDRLRAVIA